MNQNFCAAFLLNTIFLHQNVLSVPVDYCLQPLNRSNCDLKPTPVFSYYKPGSRCEIEMWRGCPTFNKFDTEFACSDLCIGKIYPEDNKIDTDNNSKSSDNDTCSELLNTDKCADEEVTVYTYQNQSCVPITWGGCPSGNKFLDEASCIKTCVKVNNDDWKKELEALPEDDIEKVNNILNILEMKETRTAISETTTFEINHPETSTVTELTTTLDDFVEVLLE